MPLGPCFNILNTDFFDNLNLQIEACEDPIELQAIIDKVFAELSTLQGVLEGELAYLADMIPLLTIPINPTEAVTWISNFITKILTPFVKPYTTIIAQIAELASLVATVEAAIANAQLKFPDFHLNVPGITVTCQV